MALRLMDGFNNYTASGDIVANWDNAPNGGFVTGRRPGTNAAYQSGIPSVTKTFDAQSTWIVGLAVFYYNPPYNNANCIAFYTTAGEQISLRVNPATMQLFVTRNGTTLWDSGTDTRYKMIYNVWNYIEFKATIDPTAGSWALRMNGHNSTLVSQTGVNTAAQGGTTANKISTPSGGWWAGFTDVYICDGTGTVCNDFLGDCRVDQSKPDADGTYSDFTKSSGATSYNLLTSNDGDTSYISGTTVGNTTTVNTAALPITPAIVYGMTVLNYAKRNATGTSGIKNVIRTNGADYVAATEKAMTTSYAASMTLWSLNPATSALFTTAEINALEIGVQISS